jgi:alpha-beta hydrolase superfamily lysophospholipase
VVNSKKNPAVEEVLFLSEKFLLKGFLHLPLVHRPPLVIGSHGLFSDKNSPKQIQLAQQCTQRNIAFFRFDHRGCGESDAPFAEKTSLAARCTDLIAAANMLKTRNDLGAQVGLFGSSMGGTVCLAAARDVKPAALVTWAAPLRSMDLIESEAARKGVENGNMPFKNNPFDISNQLSEIDNILILHSEKDETVPLSHASEIFKRVREPKKLILFSGSDHRMSRTADQQKFMRLTASWFESYLKPL